ncbi:hypothetical protein, partial [Prevotellamassilia timonensis]|uniref:hypothetical protein n=1 Tax=Prevotellamassilia timonensis TaxID=1852370 RepID=UPI001F459298
EFATYSALLRLSRCGFALDEFTDKMRFLPGKDLFLSIALRWRQPDRGMMWQAANPELAREFPAGTASKARQSRLHQAQG